MTPDRTRRLIRVARLAAPGCVALATAPFLTIPATWWSAAPPAPAALGVIAPSAPFRALGAVASLLPAAAMAWGLLRLRRYFRGVARGGALTRRGAHDLRAFACALVIQAGLGPVSRALAGLAATWERGPGARSLMLSVSDRDLGALVVAALVLAASWTLTEAVRLDHERRLIV